MQLLFNVYGIAGVMPREGMDISHSLPAPTAALMAAITEAVFRNNLPWVMMLIGALIILAIILLVRFCNIRKTLNLSILGVAIGMYLPLSSSFPLFLGGMIAWFVQVRHKKQNLAPEEANTRTQRGTLIACGLVAGSAIMDVLLAIPFSLLHSPNALKLVGVGWESYSVLLALLSTTGLGIWIIRRV
jgi:putative OPT family oligopeptide transporter